MLTYTRYFKWTLFYLISFTCFTSADSFKFNSYNNHGVLGIINMPSARFYNESSHGITFYDGNPDQKITLSSNPYDWLEASFFYTNIQGQPYCEIEFDPVCNQDYKDKGFNFKVRIKEEGYYPAIAIGINDIVGSGVNASEYIVASYGLNDIDFHFGLGWGTLNGSSSSFKNPLGYLHDQFNTRSSSIDNTYKFEGTGSLQTGRYFSGEISPFYGFSYALNKRTLLKIERDTTLIPKNILYKEPQSDYSFALEYNINKNFTIGLSQERGNFFSLKFIYKNNPNKFIKPYKYKQIRHKDNENKYTKLIKNIENNGIGVNKIIETSKSIGIELTQFAYPNLDVVEEIIRTASLEAGINKEIKKDMRIANLQAISEYDKSFERNSKLIYQREQTRSFSTDTNLKFRPFLASREEFFKGALLLENDSEYVISDNFFFSSNLKYSLADNLDDLTIPPRNTYPAQVRSDVKSYLTNFDDGIFIGRAQFDFHFTPQKNNHFMITAGILEEMFSGYGFEYLFFKHDNNYAAGFEIFDIKKRDYNMRFGTLDYQNITGSVNFYLRNYKIIPFDMKMSYGEYLAGDEGLTIELSRSYLNGTEFGIFASFTDVSAEQFGEGAFDKGIFFNIPIYGDFINYTWKPLTKDPGAKLNRKHTLYDLLVKFRPYNP